MSLRQRLPLTYGLIALLAALALGAVLLLILRDFYSRQEIAYMDRNAVAIGEMLAGMGIEDEVLIEKQMRTLAALTQMRIRVFDSAENLIVDTDQFAAADSELTLSLAIEGDGVSHQFSQVTEDDTFGPFTNTEINVSVDAADGSVNMRSSLSGNINSSETIATPWNFGFNATADGRSNQVVRETIPGIIQAYGGYVELSEGPAFGQAIVRNVAWGLLIAGSLAVAIATGVGALIARRITQPLHALTATTAQLESGDLSIRSEIQRTDEIGRLSISFNRMADRVETTVSSLQRFVADAAHEIHTPITALRTNLELARDAAPNTPDNARFIDEAHAQTLRIQQLTDSLLQLSRLEGMGNSAEYLPLNLTALVTERSEFYAARAEQQGLNFTLDCPPEPVCINGNAEQLQRAIDNLLDNAIKFSRTDGNVRVTIAAGANARLSVSNQGIGIDGEPSRIFDRFHRAPNAAAYPGSGLGLAITQQIIAAHTGALTLQQTETETRFIITLPLPKPSPTA